VTSGPWSVALAVATAAHAGFQATVTLLVYPALVRVPAEDWARAHATHSRRVTALVGVVYGAVVVACVGAVSTSPGSTGVLVAAAASAGVLGVTAVAAAPTHTRLAAGRTDRLVARLLVVDRLRLLLALVALAGAVAAALG
jgi:hypothetical protein